MAFNVNSLPEYVEQNRLPLLAKATLGAKSLSQINIQTGVKHKAALNLVGLDPVLQPGGCGFNAQGDVTFSQREIYAPLIKINMELCDKDLIQKWLNYQVNVAAGKETLPFEQVITDELSKKIAEKVEKLVWDGDDTLGVKGLLDWETEYVDGGIGYASAYEAILGVYMKIPAEVLDGSVIFVGEDTYRAFTRELCDKNLYHYNGEYDGGEIVIPGTNVKVVALNGLNGSKRVIAARPENLFWGVDMQNDAEVFDIWYSQDNRIFRIAVQFNGGSQVAYPSEVVVGKLA